MATLRVRHAKGASTLQINFDTLTLQDLQKQIFAVSDIPPSEQEIKFGYPPKALAIVSELTLSNLGLKAGEQIIVNRRAGSSHIPQGPTVAPESALYTTQTPSSGASSQLSSTSRNAATAPAPRSRVTSTKTGQPDAVETDGGFFVHRIVPDDNSCLFSSVALIFEQSISKAHQIRQIVAQGIRSDSETFSEAILGSSPDKYISAILKPSTWGGAIELTVLAKHYNTEIASIDVETGRIDRFEPPPGLASGNRCILFYSGIHYDAASMAPMIDAPPAWHQTVFPIIADDEQDPVLSAGKKLVDILRSKKAYTNTTTFDLRCEDCGQGLKGEKDARAHAQATGHVRFGEY